MSTTLGWVEKHKLAHDLIIVEDIESLIDKFLV